MGEGNGEKERARELEARERGKRERRGQEAPFIVSLPGCCQVTVGRSIPGCCQVTVGWSLDRMLAVAICTYVTDTRKDHWIPRIWTYRCLHNVSLLQG